VLSLAALLLVAVSVGGTIAYLQDATKPVENVFTTSHVDIDLTETKKTFKMVPGTSIEKDPKVTVKANSEACWLFVKVDKSENLDDYIEYKIAAGWNKLEDGVYYIEQPATTADVSYFVLDGNFVTVKNGLDNKEMTTAETQKPTLTFTAYAVQKEAADTAAKAWEIAKDLTFANNGYQPATNP
jgi:hypothetical protein